MLTIFGSIAVAIMFLSYWLEPRSRWFVLSFAGGCAATSLYSALAQVYPITVIEALWGPGSVTEVCAQESAGGSGWGNCGPNIMVA